MSSLSKKTLSDLRKFMKRGHLGAMYPEELEALITAVEERDVLKDAVERVRALHWAYEDADSGKWCGFCQSDFDATDGDAAWWPCPTIRALEGKD